MIRDELYELVTGRYENVKPHLQIIMRDYNEYENRLKDNNLVYTRYGAFAATYYVRGFTPGEEGLMAAISQGMVDRWGISMDTLHTDALNAMRFIDPPVFENIASAIRQLEMEDDVEVRANINTEKLPMWVLTSEQHCLGAGYMTDPKILQTIGQYFKEDYYLLPSSVNEMICVPKRLLKPVEAAQMVYTANHSGIVSEEERLSDIVYIYDIKKQELVQSEKYDPRTARQEQGLEKQQLSRRPHLSL